LRNYLETAQTANVHYFGLDEDDDLRVGSIVLVSRNIPGNIILDFTITSWLTIDTMPK
jgi:hypothetical protein